MNQQQIKISALLVKFHKGEITVNELETAVLKIQGDWYKETGEEHLLEYGVEEITRRFENIRANIASGTHDINTSLTSSGSLLYYFEDPDEC